MPQTVDRPLHPIIRWAGSKRKVISQLLTHVPSSFGRYIEPFAGSACLFFAMCPEKAILADRNMRLIEMYETVARHPIRVLRKAKAIPANPRTYYRIRNDDSDALAATEKAARFLYLNRYCFNALYRTNAAGVFNVPFGTRTGGFLDESEFKRSALQLRKAELFCGDFEATLARARRGDFVYLDPPYASAARLGRNEYGQGSFSTADLPRLVQCLDVLNNKGVQFLLSYSYSSEIMALLPRRIRPKLSIQRHIAASSGKRCIAQEILADNTDIFGVRAKH